MSDEGFDNLALPQANLIYLVHKNKKKRIFQSKFFKIVTSTCGTYKILYTH